MFFRILSKVICTCVLFLGLMFIVYVFYVFIFVFDQSSRTCLTQKSAIEIKSSFLFNKTLMSHETRNQIPTAI